jgi:hypothetical protein
MFYYKNWDKFCCNLKNLGIKVCTAEESLTVAEDTQFVVLKHDVEDKVANAHRLAQIEAKYGFRTTYYVQAYLLDNSNNISLLKDLQRMGHEISYHYDVLDANNGDYDKAEQDFNNKLEKFHSNGFYFNTICQHGNPVKCRVGYTSNRDFFRCNKIRQKYASMVDVVVNYSKSTKHQYKYISDAGYCWKVICEPETNDLNTNAETIKLNGFCGVLDLLNTGESIILSTHPHRWKNTSLAIYAQIVFFRLVRIIALIIKRIPLCNKVMNKFYFLAKKI